MVTHPGLPLIRACTSNAPGSSGCGSLYITRSGCLAATRGKADIHGRDRPTRLVDREANPNSLRSEPNPTGETRTHNRQTRGGIVALCARRSFEPVDSTIWELARSRRAAQRGRRAEGGARIIRPDRRHLFCLTTEPGVYRNAGRAAALPWPGDVKTVAEEADSGVGLIQVPSADGLLAGEHVHGRTDGDRRAPLLFGHGSDSGCLPSA